MKLIGRLLVVTAMLTSVVAFMGSGTVGAATDTATYPTIKCSLSLFGGAPFPPEIVPDTVNLQIGITAPDSVAPGASAAYTVSVGGSPGLKNAEFSDFNNGRAEVTLLVNGTPLVSPAVVIPDTPKNGVIVVPDINGLTPALNAATTLEVSRLRYYTINATSGAVVADSTCLFPATNRAAVTVGVTTPTTTTTTTTTGGPGPTAPTTAPPTTAAPTTAAPTTAAPTTAAPTTAAPTTRPTTPTTAAPPPPPAPTPTTAPSSQAKLQTETKTLTYLCDVAYEGGLSLPDQASVVDVTISAPDKATAGTQFPVTLDVQPGIGNGPVQLPAGIIRSFVAKLLVGGGGSPAVVEQKNPTNSAPVGPFGAIPVPRLSAKVTASGAPGQKVTFAPGDIVVATSPAPPNLPNPGTVSCSAPSDAILSTAIVAESVVQVTDPPPPPPSVSTAAAAGGSGGAGSGSTSGSGSPSPQPAPVTASGGSAGVQAQVIEESAQVAYECEIYSGSNLITTQQDTQTVTIRTVDKVAPGGTLSFQMSLAPGPKTGPVALPNGVQNVTVAAAAGGGASPSAIPMSAGDLPAAVATNSNVKIPTVSGSTRATGSAGESITLTAADMRFETARPPSRTECTAQNPPVITTTQIVEGVDSAAASESLAFTGSSRGWLAPMALAQVVIGIGLVLMQRRRRTA